MIQYPKVLFFLWRHLPKRVAIIKGATIEYLLLPKWLLFHSAGWKKTQYVPAISLVHYPTKTGMVFISTSEPDWRRRYTIFHEWHETRTQLRQDKDYIRSWNTFHRTLEVLSPELEMELEHMACIGRFYHSYALATELRLAKHEMAAMQFEQFVQEAYKNRIYKT